MSAPGRVRRRTVLAAGTLGLVVGTPGLAGCAPSADGPDDGGGGAYCVPVAGLERRRRLAGLPLVYEPTGRATAFAFDAGFGDRLEAWAQALPALLPAAPETLTTYGSWIDGGSECDSWHHAGRAFDLAAVRLADGSAVSCRYDRWRTTTGTELARHQRRYWAVAAGLHARFAYVLTYLYDGAHANHIHLDNGRSGDGDPTFSPRSRVQVQMLQAACRHLWDTPLETSGVWDAATRRGVAGVLDRLGLDDDPATSWTAFLNASSRRMLD